MTIEFGDYIAYVDESGDHSLSSIDPDFPIFVLAFCIVRKSEYANFIVPSLKNLKFNTFGHDSVIFHEREIRKQEGPFRILQGIDAQKQFYDGMNSLLSDVPMTVVAAAIRKDRLCKKYGKPESPYNLALGFCLEKTAKFLKSEGQTEKMTHIIVESRGKREDKDLELEYRRMMNGSVTGHGLAYNFQNTKFEIMFTPKQANMAGLQIADLVARPIARYALNHEQPNRAMDIIRKKFWCGQGAGLKIFPKS